MPIHLVHRIVVQIVHATLLRFAYTARINKQSRTIVQTILYSVPTFILYCSRSFSAVVFVLVLHLSFVISNYMETFGGCHLPPVAYSVSSTRCPLHRCLASTNIHKVTAPSLEIQIPIARSPRLFVRSHVPHHPYNID